MKILLFLISLVLIFIYAAGWVKIVLLVLCLLIFLFILYGVIQDPMSDTPPYPEDIDWVDDEDKSASEMEEEALKAHNEKWSDTGNEWIFESSEEYKTISNYDNIYLGSKDINYSDYQEPIINEEKAAEFLKWAKNKKSINQEAVLIDSINKKLQVIPPDVKVNLLFDLKTDGAFFCEDFNAYGFRIYRFKTPHIFEFDNETWVNLITEPYLFDWIKHTEWEDESIWGNDDNYHTGTNTYYLKGSLAEFVPPSKNSEWYFEEDILAEYEEHTNTMLADDIKFSDLVFKVNNEEFNFLEKEKDYLVTLLMVTYNSNILGSNL